MHKTHIWKRERKMQQQKKQQEQEREGHREYARLLGKNLNDHVLIGSRFWPGFQELILSNLQLKAKLTTRSDHFFLFFISSEIFMCLQYNLIWFWYVWRHLKFRVCAFISLLVQQLTVVSPGKHCWFYFCLPDTDTEGRLKGRTQLTWQLSPLTVTSLTITLMHSTIIK